VIKLGTGNDDAAREALAAARGWLQVGGGIDRSNAMEWLNAGASQVIVTSSIFKEGQLDWDELRALSTLVGKEHLVLDLSCRWRDGCYWIVMDRWQRFTDTPIDPSTLNKLAIFCDEFLVHGVDVEGKQQGMDERLIALLAEASPIPVVYAGGVRALDDLQKLRDAGSNQIDVTVGSALDLFGGALPFEQVIAFCDEAT
jgi:phosphoribosylformimino-5-aminoimidazole carboxamide ribotide isomerase